MLRIFTSIIILISLPGVILAQDAFNPNLLIEDSRFSDTETLGGAEGIQKFLEIKGSVLANTSPDFLIKLSEPSDPAFKSALPDPRPNLGRLRTAAELIYDASVSAGLNPQVVLVTLQKEQSLIDGNFSTDSRLQRALDRSLGFGCPDGGSCGQIFLGFYHQLFGNFDSEGNRYIGMPMSLMRSFDYQINGQNVGRGPWIDSSGRAYGNGSRIRQSFVSDVITMENTTGPPYNAPAIQNVTLGNRATAALYRYTPHVYNGNYNFWRFFSQWFRYPNGTLIQRSGDSKIYVIDNGLKRLVSSFVINQRGLDPAGLITVSPTEFADFQEGDVMLPKEGTLIKNSAGAAYLIEDSSKKQISSFVAAQRGLNTASAIALEDNEIQSYRDGGRALPEEGTLVKSSGNPAVYIITNNEKRLLSGFVFNQRGFKFADVLTAEPGELDSYPAGAIMPPLDNTLVKGKGAPAVYHVGNGLLEPLTLFVFTTRGFKFADVVSVSDEEIASWQKGKPMPPPTGTLVKSKDNPTVYYIAAGTRRPVSYDLFIISDFDFRNVRTAPQNELEAIEIGEDLRLPERTLVKTKDSPAVYYVVDGVLRPLTLTAFQNRRLRFEDVYTISDIEFAKYEVGTVVEN